MEIFRNILIIIALACTTDALSNARWWIKPDNALTKFQIEDLQRSWPTIRNAAELDKLLSRISTTGDFSQVEAIEHKGNIEIQLKRASRIGKISVHSTTREVRNNIKSQLFVYQQQVDSKELRTRIEKDIKSQLGKIGFLKPRITVAAFPQENMTKLVIDIDEDLPCLIRDIQLGFTIPKEISLEIDVGEICDINEIYAAILSLKEDLLSNGYNQFRIANPELRFDPLSNSGLVFINGSISPKVRSLVESPLTSTPLLRFLSDDDLHSIDSTITDPNTMKTEILRKFRSKGYQDVIVNPPKTKSSKEEIVYVFSVEPGTKYYIQDVHVDGANIFSRDEALKIMDVFTTNSSVLQLNDEIIRNAIDSLHQEYSQRGYWDIKIPYPQIKKNSRTGETTLSFKVNEGKQRVFNQLYFRGHRAISDSNLEALFPIKKKNRALTWGHIFDLQQAIQDEYKRLGYLYTKVKIDLIQNRRFRRIPTNISVTIQEGPRVKIGKISLKGLVKTKPEVILRELAIREGDWYSPAKVDQSRQALVDLGLFSTVSISASNTSDFSKEKLVIPYTVSIKETKPGQVSFGPGWSWQKGGRFALDSSYSNIHGMGRKAFLNASYSEESNQSPIGDRRLLGYNLGLGFIEPYFLYTPFDGIITLSQSAEANDETWELIDAVQATLSENFTFVDTRVTAEIFGIYKVTQERASEEVSYILKADEVQIRESGFRTTLDRRDDIRWPRGGFVLSTESSWADFYLGGDTKFFHWSFKSSNYFEVHQNYVLASRLSLESFSDVRRLETSFDFLPSSELIQSGGPETNRGFRYGDLGPVVSYTTDTGELEELRVGGSHAFGFSLELRHRVSDSFGMTFFLDSSNSFITSNEASALQQRIANGSFQNAELKDNISYDFVNILQDPSLIIKNNYLSYGISANYLTPLGSINLSYGFPFRRCPLARPCSETGVIPRGNAQFRKIRGGQVQINVGTNF